MRCEQLAAEDVAKLRIDNSLCILLANIKFFLLVGSPGMFLSKGSKSSREVRLVAARDDGWRLPELCSMAA